MVDNVFGVLNAELERLHILFNKQMSYGTEAGCKNANIFMYKIDAINAELLKIMKDLPSNDKQIKELESTVADMILTGYGTKDE